MYTLKDLQDKNLKELKEIGSQLNVQPEGDRRCRQNWIDALIGINPPLLQLLEVPPVEVEPVDPEVLTDDEKAAAAAVIAIAKTDKLNLDLIKYILQDYPIGDVAFCKMVGLNTRTVAARVHAINAAARKGDSETLKNRLARILQVKTVSCGGWAKTPPAPIETTETQPGKDLQQLPYSVQEPTAKPIAQTEINAPISNEPARPESIDLHNSRAQTAQPDRTDSSAKAEALGSKEGDRILAVAGSHQGNQGRALRDRANELDGPVTFSPRFLATYPPYFGEIRYKAEATGQLNLLEAETDDEPPDPDDFELLEDFKRAIALWDAQHPEPIEISLDSMCEWAQCPDEWYEPAAESSSTCFSIPTFDAWCDRANRQADSDEPPDTWNFAKLPGPKPPKFPPRAIGQSDNFDRNAAPQTHIKSSSIVQVETESKCRAITYPPVIPINSAVQSKLKRILSRNYPETIPKLFHSIAAGSTQLGRSPPGGDGIM